MFKHSYTLSALTLGAALIVSPAIAQVTTPPTDETPKPAATSPQSPVTPTTNAVAQGDTTTTATPTTPKASAKGGRKSWNDLDVDKDGNLSKAEAAGDPSMKAIFAKADANGDGMLTADEYRAYYARYLSSVTPY